LPKNAAKTKMKMSSIKPMLTLLCYKSEKFL